MQKNSAGIYDNNITTSQCQKIKQYLTKKYDVNDFCIFSDAPTALNLDKDIPIVSSFHMIFYNGYIVFTNQNNLDLYKNKTLSDKLILLTDEDMQNE